MFDLIIIGAGPAGMSASVYASKANLNRLLIESDTLGGLLNKINKIDNQRHHWIKKIGDNTGYFVQKRLFLRHEKHKLISIKINIFELKSPSIS